MFRNKSFIQTVMVHACNSSTREAESGGFLSSRPAWTTEWFPGQPGLPRETLSQANKQKQKNKKTKTNKQKQEKRNKQKQNKSFLYGLMLGSGKLKFLWTDDMYQTFQGEKPESQGNHCWALLLVSTFSWLTKWRQNKVGLIQIF